MNSDIVAAGELAALAAENVRLGARVVALEAAIDGLLYADYGCGCCGDWGSVIAAQDAARAALTPAPSSAGKGGGK